MSIPIISQSQAMKSQFGYSTGIQDDPFTGRTYNVVSDADYYKSNQPVSTSSGYTTKSKVTAPEEPQTDSSEALIALLLQQQRLAEQRLREQMAAANSMIDRNADSAISQMEQDRIDQQRQSYISKEKAMTALPQSSLAVGGGGLSETSLMGINSEYENSMQQLINAFNRNKTDVLNEAANLKSSNEINLTNQIMDFENATSKNLFELAQTPGMDTSAISMAVSSLAGDYDNSSYLARLRAAGISDEQLRAWGLL